MSGTRQRRFAAGPDRATVALPSANHPVEAHTPIELMWNPIISMGSGVWRSSTSFR